MAIVPTGDGTVVGQRGRASAQFGALADLAGLAWGGDLAAMREGRQADPQR